MSKMKDELKNDPLMPMRHSCEHVLHWAMTDLFPGLKRAMGPATSEGFYFDFDYSEPISEKDFEKIEARMKELIDADLPITKKEVSADEARDMFAGNEYKQEWINEAEKRGEKITIYWTGEPHAYGSDFDLCSGPHVSSTGKIGPFKLLSVAGAYWRGDEKNKMLSRIYGTCFATQEEMDRHLASLDDAKKRDHRRLGRELDLFVFSELVGSGLPMFTPKGTIIRRELENFVRQLQEEQGYQQVLIPHLAKKELYKASGHWDKYSENIFKVEAKEGDEGEWVLKPMNCPHHIQIFASRLRSYRELPQRYAEVTAVYRNEKAGQLMGLTRVYMLTQDDAHVFCTEDQAIEESLKVYEIIRRFYEPLGLTMGMKVRMSLKDPAHPEKYLGDEELWKKSEDMMREVAKRADLEVYDGVGEAAFYAPKLDFMAYDALGREWQLATIQLDMNFAERFSLQYVDKDGSKKRPVIIHRAILGSVERFMGIIIEHFAGSFPVWLAPVQIELIPISSSQNNYALKLKDELSIAGLRVEIDDRDEKMQAKIRDAQLMKIPYMFIVGKREEEANSVSVRLRDGKDLGMIDFKEALSRVKDKYQTRSLDL